MLINLLVWVNEMKCAGDLFLCSETLFDEENKKF